MVYFDNAATTPVPKAVADYIKENQLYSDVKSEE